jgi:rubredoxin
MAKHLCIHCGFIYNEQEGYEEDGIQPGTKWQDVPDTWVCPDCAAMKSDFEEIE